MSRRKRAATRDAASGAAPTYAVHYAPPAYPVPCRPWTCRHPPQSHVIAEVVLDEAARRVCDRIAIHHAVCLGCGRTLPSTVGGNVLVDLSRVIEAKGWSIPIFRRAEHLRGRWGRIALKLFGPDGWTGRHERVARLIDPNLTMRLDVVGRTRAGDPIASLHADACFFGLPEPDAATPDPPRWRARGAPSPTTPSRGPE